MFFNSKKMPKFLNYTSTGTCSLASPIDNVDYEIVLI
jgi:hypothetical protein